MKAVFITFVVLATVISVYEAVQLVEMDDDTDWNEYSVKRSKITIEDEKRIKIGDRTYTHSPDNERKDKLQLYYCNKDHGCEHQLLLQDGWQKLKSGELVKGKSIRLYRCEEE